jgi:hypothetical protein
MAFSDRFRTTEAVSALPPGTLIAAADFNGDGLTDFMLSTLTAPVHTAQPVVVALSNADGTYRFDTAAAPSTLRPEEAHGVAADFNGDGKIDVALFDSGNYDRSKGGTLGHPPTLLLGDGAGKFTASDALAAAVLAAPKGTYLGTFTDADLGVKDVASGDIDNDGDIDLWVESTGADNIVSHFEINQGGGVFTVDPTRLDRTTLLGPAAQDFFRYGHADLKDVDGDGWLDLVMLQIRDNDRTHINESSVVVYNDKTGHFPLANRVALPTPDFYYGYTSADSVAYADLNGDGKLDMVVAHTRNDGVTGPQAETPATGRYLQVLIANGDRTFHDETAARMGDQSATLNPPNNASNNPKKMFFMDVDRDGDLDLVLSQSFPLVSISSPFVMLNDGLGRFIAMSPAGFIPDGQTSSANAAILGDFNHDGLLDFAWQPNRPGGTSALVINFGKLSADAQFVSDAYRNILRADAGTAADAQVLGGLTSGVDAGTLTRAVALTAIYQKADATTSVASLAYQFFTGSIPSSAGMDYLVSPTGSNPNNLNSAYYQGFNMENRYINFAVNLGKVGAGHASFEAGYGSKTLFDTMKTAYATIFGSEPTDTKVHALLDSRADYFASYGQDGANGIGTKAAAVGWLLAEAAKADIGTLQTANLAFLADLADGATFGVSLTTAYHGIPFTG